MYILIALLFACLLNVNLVCINSNSELMKAEKSELMDFNDYFKKIKDKDIVEKFKNVKYYGPFRSETPRHMVFRDSTEAMFKFYGVKFFNVVKDKNNVGEDKIKELTKQIYDISTDLGFIAVEYDTEKNYISFNFKLSNFADTTLPKYVGSKIRLSMPDFKWNEYKYGVLIYLYDSTFTTAGLFDNLQPVRLENNWYYYTE